MATLTDKEQSLPRTVVLARVSAHGASLTRRVGIDFDRHRVSTRGFVGDHDMQFSKGPLALTGVCLTLFPGRFLAMLADASLANVCQVLQANEGMWVLFHNTLTHSMIHVLLQSSLSFAHRSQATGSSTSAFLLKTLFQSCVVVRLGNHFLSRMEGRFSLHGATDRQVAHSDVHPNNAALSLRGGIGGLDFKRDQQVELLPGFVIPQLRGPKTCALSEKSHMLLIARIGENHTPIQAQDADLLVLLQAVVMTKLIGQGGRDIRGSLAKSFIALLRQTRFACRHILLDLRP